MSHTNPETRPRGTFAKQSVLLVSLFMLTAGLALAPPTAADGTTLIVDDDGADCPDAGFTSIQGAIQAASGDDTIEVCAGTYEEALFVEGLDGLTLAGAGSDAVTIDASATAGRDIDVGGSPGAPDQDVSLTGFTLVGGDDFGIKAAFVDGFTVEDVVVEESARTGLDLNTVDNAQIADVQSRNNDANGIAVRNAVNVTITDTETQGNAWGGLAFYAPGTETVENVLVSNSQFASEPAGLYLQYDGYTDIRIEGSSFTGNDVGLAVDDSFGGPPEADEVSVQHSTFDGNDAGVVNDAQAVLDATENWWGSPLGPTHEDNELSQTGLTGSAVGDFVDYEPWCESELCLLPVVQSP